MKKFCLVSALLCLGLAQGAPSSDDSMISDSPSPGTSKPSDSSYSTDSSVTQEKSPRKKIQPPSQEVVDKLVKDSDIFDGTSRISGTTITQGSGYKDTSSSNSLSNGLSCKDILLTTIPVPQDADANLVMQFTYSLCMVELVIQQYIAHQKNTSKSDPVLLQQSQVALKKIQQMLPLFLLGYLSTVDSFVNQDLRESINEKRKELTNQ